MWVYFDVSAASAYQSIGGALTKYQIKNDELTSVATGYSRQDLSRISNLIVKKACESTSELETYLRQQEERRRANAIFGAIANTHTDDFEVTPYLQHVMENSKESSYFISQIRSNFILSGRDVLDKHLRIEKNLNNLGWGTFYDDVFEGRQTSHLNPFIDCWSRIKLSSEAPRPLLSFKFSNSNFFDTMAAASSESLSPQDAFFEYAKLIGTFDRKGTSIESDFFDCFELLSRKYSRRKHYYLSTRANFEPRVHSVDEITMGQRKLNDIRKRVERELSNLADRQTHLSQLYLRRTPLTESDQSHFENYLADWNTSFHSMTHECSNVIENYFSSRNKTAPRITLKFLTQDEGKLRIVSRYRNHRISYSRSSDFSKNTGFMFAVKTGQPFLNNNLPAAYCAEVYSNPRLEDTKRISPSKKSWVARGKEVWGSLWDSGSQADPRASYKSTMIFPIQVNKTVDSHSQNLDENEYQVTAFLCIDHDVENYFSPKIDIGFIEQAALLLGTYFGARKSILVNAEYVTSVVRRKKMFTNIIRIRSRFSQLELESQEIEEFFSRENQDSQFHFADPFLLKEDG